MNKKSISIFLLLILFIFSIGLALSVSLYRWGNCAEAVGNGTSKIKCGVMGENWIPFLGQNILLDEDDDSNVSFELCIINEEDFNFNKVTWVIEKCSKEIKLDSIKSGGKVNIKIDDICVYEYYDIFNGKMFWSNSSFTYFDRGDNLISHNGEFMFPVIKKTEFEKLVKKRELKEKVLAVSKIVIPLILLFIIIFVIIKKFKRSKK